MRTLPVFFLAAICFSLSFCPPKPGSGRITVKIDDLPAKCAFAIALFKSADGFPFNLNKAYRVKHFGVPVAPDSIRASTIIYKVSPLPERAVYTLIPQGLYFAKSGKP